MFLKSDMSMLLDMLIFVILMHYHLVYISAKLFSFQHVTILIISINIRNIFVTLMKFYFHQGVEYTKFSNFCLYIQKRVNLKTYIDFEKCLEFTARIWKHELNRSSSFLTILIYLCNFFLGHPVHIMTSLWKIIVFL